MMRAVYKYSGILGIVALWSSVIYGLIVTRLNILGKLPISYLGVYENSRNVFNYGLIASSVFLLIWIYGLSQHTKLSKSFKLIFTIGQLCQILVALTPFNSQSIGHPIHVVSAFGLAFTLPLSMYTFLKSDGISKDAKVLTRKLLKIEILMFVLGIGWFILGSTAGALSEIITAVVFDLWIIMVSYKLMKQ